MRQLDLILAMAGRPDQEWIAQVVKLQKAVVSPCLRIQLYVAWACHRCYAVLPRRSV